MAATMQEVIGDFQTAYTRTECASLIAQFLSPIPPDNDPSRLYSLVRTTNQARVTGDVQYAVESRMRRMMGSDELRGWVDIISCYWRAVDRIIKDEEAQRQGRPSERHALDVYEAWKDLTSSFMKHISNGALPYWTVFTLCLTANHLRTFAIKADAQMARVKPVSFNTGFQDDIVTVAPRSEKLEEATRLFNRIFALCLGDRWVFLCPSCLLCS